jgi:hypothetical protein
MVAAPHPYFGEQRIASSYWYIVCQAGPPEPPGRIAIAGREGQRWSSRSAIWSWRLPSSLRCASCPRTGWSSRTRAPSSSRHYSGPPMHFKKHSFDGLAHRRPPPADTFQSQIARGHPLMERPGTFRKRVLFGMSENTYDLMQLPHGVQCCPPVEDRGTVVSVRSPTMKYRSRSLK